MRNRVKMKYNFLISIKVSNIDDNSNNLVSEQSNNSFEQK